MIQKPNDMTCEMRLCMYLSEGVGFWYASFGCWGLVAEARVGFGCWSVVVWLLSRGCWSVVAETWLLKPSCWAVVAEAEFIRGTSLIPDVTRREETQLGSSEWRPKDFSSTMQSLILSSTSNLGWQIHLATLTSTEHISSHGFHGSWHWWLLPD